MRWVCLPVRAVRAAVRLCSSTGTSVKNDKASGSERTTQRELNRRKPADTFGTLRTFEEKLLPLKIPHQPRIKANGVDAANIVDEGWEGSYEEEEIGWTPNYLHALRKQDAKNIPVITEPVTFGKHLRKVRKKIEALEKYEKLYGVDRSTARVVIECARKEYNHYEGMRYPPGDIQLASQYWTKSKYKNDWFTINSVTMKNPSFNRDEAFSWDENTSLISPVIIENARKLGFRFPTVIQRRTFRAFKSGAHLLIAAETGSGKTLAYAAPLLSLFMQDADKCKKGIVLVPTHALRMQTANMINELANGTHIRIVGGTEGWRHEKLGSEENWNIIVSTPSFSPAFISSLNFDYVILDEADMLLDNSFSKDIIKLLGQIKIRHSVVNKDTTDGARLIFSTATYPDQLQLIAESIVDNEHLHCVKTENLHCLMPHIKQTFIRIKEVDKVEKLKELLQKGLTFPCGQTLVFCKDFKNVSFISTVLREVGVEHVVFGGGRQIEHLIDDLRSGSARVIVATDVASRGLDLPQLRHIVNYDFPRQISDYVHRCGRIGRVGSLHKCLITSFVRRGWEVKHVNTIELAARLERPLEDVELNDPARLRGLQRDLS